MTPPQSAPLLSPMLLLALILVLLLIAPLPLTDSIAEPAKERGSRSTGPVTTGAPASLASLGNASATGRDFRFTTAASHGNALPPTATSVYTSDDIDGDLIGGRVRDSFVIDDLIWNKTGERDTRMWEDERMNTSRNDKSLANSLAGGPEKAFRRRNKRQQEGKPWIEGGLVNAEDERVKMHVLVVKDEDIPDCGRVANKYTRKRYFMCSGAILNANRVLTSATCVNRAQIHKFNIQADIGVLLGAVAADSYVIKVDRILIHPHYIPDPNSPNHALNNIAMLTLACPIPEQLLVIPKLPYELYTDVGHMCCPDRCKVLTVVEDVNLNYHFLKYLISKHLPLPLHDYDLEDIRVTAAKSLLNSTKDGRSIPPSKNKKTLSRTRTHVREKRETKKRLPARHFAKNSLKKLKLSDDKEKVDVKESDISFRDSDSTDVVKPENDETVDKKDSKSPTNDKNASDNDETVDDKNSKSPTNKKKASDNDETVDDKNSKSPTNKKKASDNDETVDDKNSKLPTKENNKPNNDKIADNKDSKSPTNDKNASDNDETVDDKNSKPPTNDKNASDNDETVDDKSSKPPTNDKKAPNKDETGDDKDKSTADEKGIDWKKIYSELSKKAVSEDSKKQILKLSRDAMSDTMVDLTDAMTEHAVNLDNVFPYFEKILKNNLENDAPPDSDALTKKINENIGKTLLMHGLEKIKMINSSGMDQFDANNDKDLLAPYSKCSKLVPVRRNIDCPPLGSPVIANNFLVGLIVYTCDDLQNWVEWKYLDIIRNLDFIHKYY